MLLTKALTLVALTATAVLATVQPETRVVERSIQSRELEMPLGELAKRGVDCPLKKGKQSPVASRKAFRFRKHRHPKHRKHHHRPSKGAKKTSKKGKKTPVVKKASQLKKQTVPKPKTTSRVQVKKPAPTTRRAAPRPSPTSGSGSGSGGKASGIQAEMLKVHNDLRAKHGAKPLKWSSAVASSAQSWANNCKFKHSGGRFGENIAAGYRSATAAGQAWAGEASQYNFNNPGFSSGTGHFTAMVWKATTELGCAVQNCNGILGGGSAPFYVCQYNSAGNVIGQFEQNVS